MSRILVFAGTTEGRMIVEHLAGAAVPVYVCVATSYGKDVLPQAENLTVLPGRLNEKEMRSFIEEHDISLVIDATHPFAKLVTTNIRKVCEALKVDRLRILRRESETVRDVIYTDSIEEAVNTLSTTSGNVLITTGSKELSLYAQLAEYKERCYARVLSTREAMETALALGFEGAHLIAMQGPFSKEINVALLKQLHAEYIVTKESGSTGGFTEKLEAAREVGAKLIVIGRPIEESGCSFGDVCRYLYIHYKVRKPQEITIVGVGPGAKELMTLEARNAVADAELIIGSKRMVKAVAGEGIKIHVEYRPNEIKSYLEKHLEYQRIVILVSGDVGFYSGAKKLLEVLDREQVKMIPGISSITYFASKLQVSWEDARICSLHGRYTNFMEALKEAGKVFLLVDSNDTIQSVLRAIEHAELSSVHIAIGSCLSYQEESIVWGSASELRGEIYDGLSVVYLEDEDYDGYIVTQGIEDGAFIRDKVPMTKQEVRSISMAKMMLKKDSVVYDIGAGTGTVSVECGRMTTQGKIYAIEKKPEAISLIKENVIRFKLGNVRIIEGTAPESIANLEVPTHAFIGGSSGRLKPILKRLLHLNPNIRIVINTITLESFMEVMDYIKEHHIENADIVQVQIAKAKKVADYNMMTGQNPVYVISFGGEHALS